MWQTRSYSRSFSHKGVVNNVHVRVCKRCDRRLNQLLQGKADAHRLELNCGELECPCCRNFDKKKTVDPELLSDLRDYFHKAFNVGLLPNDEHYDNFVDKMQEVLTTLHDWLNLNCEEVEGDEYDLLTLIKTIFMGWEITIPVGCEMVTTDGGIYEHHGKKIDKIEEYTGGNLVQVRLGMGRKTINVSSIDSASKANCILGFARILKSLWKFYRHKGDFKPGGQPGYKPDASLIIQGKRRG